MSELIEDIYRNAVRVGISRPQVEPTETENHAAIDPATFKTIEANGLFDALNTTRTLAGRVTLYRSFVAPSMDKTAIDGKQQALDELVSNPKLRQAIDAVVDKASNSEKDFYTLLFGQFLGALGTPRKPMDCEGYGYVPYRKGTQFMLDLVAGVQALPGVTSRYLATLLGDVRDLTETPVYQLLRGPVYVTEKGPVSPEEKSRLTFSFKFRPTLFKPILIVIALLFTLITLRIVPEEIRPQLVAVYPILMVFLAPLLFLYVPIVGSFDREHVIYPLRERYKKAPEVQTALEALGKLDELLAFHRYKERFPTLTVLPKLVESPRHTLVAKQVRNPLLGLTNPNYVANDIDLSNSRLTFITGPNSGGKTAFCKTLAQVQLLAQAGCYIPAASAEIALTDRISYQAPEFSSLEDREGRFGKELAHTKSTFLVTTPKSLVIMDELAEGTTHEEKMATSLHVLRGFYRIGNNTLLITHNHQLVDKFRADGIGQYRQVEFAHEEPTYRLIEGISRVSHADRVAKKIGFAAEDIERILREKGYG